MCLDVVLSNRFIGIVADGLITGFNGDIRLSITTVIHSNIDSIAGIRLQIRQFLRQGHTFLVACNTQHFISALGLNDLGILTIPCLGPVI